MNPALITIATTVAASFINFCATKLYNWTTGANKNFLWKNQVRKMSKLTFSKSLDELKRTLRILVIDDEENFPVKLFQNEGYIVERWNKVKDYSRLESGFYDIIVLDIQGVALHISSEDGLGVLESLKKKNPAQIIIAYSQHSYDLNKSRFWEMADEKIAKPCDFLKMRGIIDNLITTKVEPNRYLDTIVKLLKENGIADREIGTFRDELRNLSSSRQQPDWEKVLRFLKNKKEVASQVITLSNTILRLSK